MGGKPKTPRMNKRSLFRQIFLGVVSLSLGAFCLQSWDSLKWFTDIETYALNWRLINGRHCPLDINHFEYVGIEQSKYDGEFFQVLDLPEATLTDDQDFAGGCDEGVSMEPGRLGGFYRPCHDGRSQMRDHGHRVSQ